MQDTEKTDDFELELETEESTDKTEGAEKQGASVSSQDELEDGGSSGFDDDEHDEKRKKLSRNARLKNQRDREREAREFWERKARELEEKLTNVNKRSRDAEEEGRKVLLSNIDGRIKSAKADLKRAFNDGDSEALADAQELLAVLAAEKKSLEGGAGRTQESFTEDPGGTPPQQKSAPNSQPKDPRLEEWLAENPWFETDMVMRGAAFGIDAQLKSENYDPSDEDFWEELDKRIKVLFPQKFQQAQSRKVAPVSRPSAGGSVAMENGKIKVRLTRDEQEAARRLNISPEDYARQKVAIERANRGWVSVGE